MLRMPLWADCTAVVAIFPLKHSRTTQLYASPRNEAFSQTHVALEVEQSGPHGPETSVSLKQFTSQAASKLSLSTSH